MAIRPLLCSIGFGVAACSSFSAGPGHTSPGGAGASSSTAGAGTGGIGGNAGAVSEGGSASDSSAFCQQFYSKYTQVFASCLGLTTENAQALVDAPLSCQRFDVAIANGRLKYDASAAAACLHALDTLGCNSSFDASGCEQAVQAQVPLGGTCKSVFLVSFNECTDGGKCGIAPNACAGTCLAGSTTPPGALNQKCAGSDGLDCAAGLYCDGDATTGICRAKKTSGPCKSTDECSLPSQCSGPSGAKTCNPIKLSGQACTPGYRECSVMSYCGNDGKCSAKLGQAGDTCGPLASGEAVLCDLGLYCDAPLLSNQTGTCQPKKTAGASCGGDSAVFQCSGNLARCDSTTQTCTACAL